MDLTQTFDLGGNLQTKKVFYSKTNGIDKKGGEMLQFTESEFGLLLLLLQKEHSFFFLKTRV